MVGNGKPDPRVGHHPIVGIAILMVVIIAVGRRRAVGHGRQRLGQIAGEMRLEMFHPTGRSRADGCRVAFRRLGRPWINKVPAKQLIFPDVNLFRQNNIFIFVYLTGTETALGNFLRALYCSRNRCVDLDRLDKLSDRDGRRNGGRREPDR